MSLFLRIGVIQIIFPFDTVLDVSFLVDLQGLYVGGIDCSSPGLVFDVEVDRIRHLNGRWFIFDRQLAHKSHCFGLLASSFFGA